MTADETICFKLLDDYARAHHGCFLAEMFSSGTAYTICFRADAVQRESQSGYACKYLKIGIADVGSAARGGALPSSTIEIVDKELPLLLKLNSRNQMR